MIVHSLGLDLAMLRTLSAPSPYAICLPHSQGQQHFDPVRLYLPHPARFEPCVKNTELGYFCAVLDPRTQQRLGE
jgi:hypothetical protein